jgi:hypothetical protein
MVISLEMKNTFVFEMDNRGSKSGSNNNCYLPVKEQRADGSSRSLKEIVRCALVAEKSVFR